MKDLISLCAVLILLMTFPIQYALNTKNHYSISLMQKHVNNAKELSRLEGYFTDKIVDDLKSSIASDFGIEKSDVMVHATSLTERKHRGELIHYEVSVPINRVIAANVFWGISNEDNKNQYTIDSYAISEWIIP